MSFNGSTVNPINGGDGRSFVGFESHRRYPLPI